MGGQNNKKHKNNKKLCWVFCFHIQKQLKDLLITRLQVETCLTWQRHNLDAVRLLHQDVVVS